VILHYNQPYNDVDKSIFLDENYLRELFSIFLRDSDVVLFEFLSRPNLFFPTNRIWGTFTRNYEVEFLKYASLLNLQEKAFSKKRLGDYFLKKEPFFKKINKYIPLGYFDDAISCSECSSVNKINIILYVTGEYTAYYNEKRIKYRLNNQLKNIFNQFKCKDCGKIIFDLPDWKNHIKKTSIESHKICEGDRIKFIFGDFRNKQGIVQRKYNQNLMIEVQLENGEKQNQSIFFARKI